MSRALMVSGYKASAHVRRGHPARHLRWATVPDPTRKALLRPDLVGVLAKELAPAGGPGSQGRRRQAMAAEDSANGLVGAAHAQLEQFALNPTAAPAGILASQAQDELAALCEKNGASPPGTAREHRPLVKNGWVEDSLGQLVKGTWRIIFDTSSWVVLADPRTIDVAVPDEYHSRWTVNLIHHLLWSEDELHRLRVALHSIGTDLSASQSVQSTAGAALADQNP